MQINQSVLQGPAFSNTFSIFFSNRHNPSAALFFGVDGSYWPGTPPFAQVGERVDPSILPAGGQDRARKRWVQPSRGELFRLETCLAPQVKLSTAGGAGEPSSAGKTSGQGDSTADCPMARWRAFTIVEAPVDGGTNWPRQFPRHQRPTPGRGLMTPGATLSAGYFPARFSMRKYCRRMVRLYVDPGVSRAMRLCMSAITSGKIFLVRSFQ